MRNQRRRSCPVPSWRPQGCSGGRLRWRTAGLVTHPDGPRRPRRRRRAARVCLSGREVAARRRVLGSGWPMHRDRVRGFRSVPETDMSTLVTRRQSTAVASDFDGSLQQWYQACEGDEVTGLGERSCHEQAVKVNPNRATQKFKVVLAGQRNPPDIHQRQEGQQERRPADLGLGPEDAASRTPGSRARQRQPDQQSRRSRLSVQVRRVKSRATARRAPSSSRTRCRLCRDGARSTTAMCVNYPSRRTSDSTPS